MSNRSRNFLIGIGVAILMVFVVAGAAILAYNAGRNSVTLLNDARPEESQDQAAVSPFCAMKKPHQAVAVFSCGSFQST